MARLDDVTAVSPDVAQATPAAVTAASPRGPTAKTKSGTKSDGSGLSLRLRLMFMLLAVFGVLQVTMSVIHLLDVRRSTKAIFTNALVLASEPIAQQVRSSSSSLTNRDLASAVDAIPDSVYWQALAATVYDSQGTLIATTIEPPLSLDLLGGPAAVAAANPHEAASSDGVPASLSAENSANPSVPTRIVGMPITDAAGGKRLLVIAAPEAFIHQVSERVTMQAVLLTPFGLLAAAVAGWLIAGFAVRPLQQMRLIASQLRPDNLAQPIDFHSTASELTQLKEQLEQMRRRIEAGYQAQERFVANVSHEIKTPIATVLTESQTLGRPDASPAEVRQFIDSTQDEMRRLGKLVESFLVLTRVRHGKPVMSTARTVSVNDIVLDSIQHCWTMAQQHNVKLDPELAVEETRDLAIHGDPELLRTLVDNLIRNAIRFSPRESKVKVLVKSDFQDDVCICVRDKGPGIPEALLDKIFDRFSQGKSEEKLGRGSGLGLEIAQGIAELHRGGITVSNLPEGGCEFCVKLPLHSLPTFAGSSVKP